MMSADSSRVKVCDADVLEPGQRIIIKCELEQDGTQPQETEVGVFNIDGDYYAIENRCAHQDGPVCDGLQQGALIGEFVGDGQRVKEYFSDEIPAIACPWHGWEYDLRTGNHLGDPAYTIPTYEVMDEDGILYLHIE